MKERASLLFYYLVLAFMVLLTFLPETKKQPPPPPKRKQKQKHKKKTESVQPSSTSSSSWDQIKNLLTCKQIEGSKIHDPSRAASASAGAYTKLGYDCSSICSFRDVVHGNTRVVHRADNSPESSSLGQETGLLRRKTTTNNTPSSSSSRSVAGTSVRSHGGGGTYSSSSRGMQLRKLSGCYECHMIVDPSRYPTPRTTICACSECGEIFPKIESLELHQSIRHAVSELGPEDSGRNIVEIIFKSSWLKKDNPICKIERILKVHNTQRTIQRFEDCRDAVKIRAAANTKKNPRCAADGNELLRFHCTTLSCSLGAGGSSSLCSAVPGCGVCTVIRHGFQGRKSVCGVDGGKGVRTTASSGVAHDCLGGNEVRRAMLVCRVIAGRVRRMADDAAPEQDEINGGVSVGSSSSSSSTHDSVAGSAGIYSNLEELYVFNPRAILPCFVVIYKTLESL